MFMAWDEYLGNTTCDGACDNALEGTLWVPYGKSVPNGSIIQLSSWALILYTDMCNNYSCTTQEDSHNCVDYLLLLS